MACTVALSIVVIELPYISLGSTRISACAPLTRTLYFTSRIKLAAWIEPGFIVILTAV